jgi:biopolymer transport protein ExbD
MTPMIDVTFLLIIFFLVSSHLAKQENFLPLDLPSAVAGTNDFAERPTLTVQVPASGPYQVNGAAMDLDQIGAAIAARSQAEGGPIRVRIRTDQAARYEPIAHLLKLCAVTGITDVVFAVYEESAR